MRLLLSCLATVVVLLTLPSLVEAAPDSILGLKSPGALRVLGGRVVGPPGFAGRGVTVGGRLVLAPGRSGAIGYQSGRALLETRVLGFAGETSARAGPRLPASRRQSARTRVSEFMNLRDALVPGRPVDPALSERDRVAVAAGLRGIFDRQDRFFDELSSRHSDGAD